MSPSRKEKAAATRRRMMSAACRVFSERGYGGTTMEAVAVRRPESPSRPLLHVPHQVRPAPGHLRVGGPRRRTAPTRVAVVAGGRDRGQRPRCGGASGRGHSADPRASGAARLGGALRRGCPGDVRLQREAAHRRQPETHRDAGRQTATRAGLSLTHARDILLALTGPQQYQLLISEYGWSREDYAEWVTGAVLRELFGVEPDSTETR